MKKIIILITILSFAFITGAEAQKEQDPTYAPYYKVGTMEGSMDEISLHITDALEASGFRIIGKYNPANKGNLRVISYTRNDLEEACFLFPDRGSLAAPLKVGLKANGN